MSDKTKGLTEIVEASIAPLLSELLSTKHEYLGVKEGVGSENFTDPNEAQDGYIPLTMGNQSLFDFNESQLQLIRDACRIVVTTDEVAKSVVKHYQNFIVGDGVRVVILPTDLGTDPTKISDLIEGNADVKQMQANWTAFYQANNLTAKLRNWVERDMRDGEALIRVFNTKKKFAGTEVPEIRFIDPALVRQQEQNEYFGLVRDPDDAEKVLFYRVYTFVQGYSDPTQKSVLVPADEVIHDKRNVDTETPRGVSSFWPVLVNIRRVSKNLRNVSVLTSILSAIALIRKHSQGTTSEKLSKFLSKSSDGQARTNPVSGRQTPNRYMQPGTVLDAPVGMEYETPAHGVKSAEFTGVIDKELAHVAINFVLPVEWLLGTQTEKPLGSGSPITKNFVTEQAALFNHLQELFWKVQTLMDVDESARLQYNVRFYGPALALDEALNEARVSEIDIRNGSLSPQTRAAQMGRDWTYERANMIQHRATAQEGEVMPGDSGNTNVDAEQPSAGQGGDGTTTKDKSQRKADGNK